MALFGNTINSIKENMGEFSKNSDLISNSFTKPAAKGMSAFLTKGAFATDQAGGTQHDICPKAAADASALTSNRPSQANFAEAMVDLILVQRNIAANMQALQVASNLEEVLLNRQTSYGKNYQLR